MASMFDRGFKKKNFMVSPGSQEHAKQEKGKHLQQEKRKSEKCAEKKKKEGKDGTDSFDLRLVKGGWGKENTGLFLVTNERRLSQT